MSAASFAPHDLGGGAVLRYLEEGDAEALFAVVDANRAHLRRWLPWLDANVAPADSLGFIRVTRRQLAAGDGFQTAIVLDGAIVGMIGFHALQRQNRQATVGYWLAEDACGRGLMTRATRAYVDHAFGPMGLNRVEIRAATENRASRGVMERLGFVEEGTIRDAEWLYDHFVDHVVYGMLAREWGAR